MTQSPLFTFVFWLVLLPALWASGSFAGFRLREQNPIFSGILTLALGLGVYAYFMILAGSMGWLKPGAVLCFIALALTFGWRKGMCVFSWLKEMGRFFFEGRDLFSRFCQISLGGTFLFTALFCFLPEIANDALAIQLYVAKLFVRNASIAPSFYDIASYRPLLMSVLYSSGLLFQNVSIAKFFHWFSGALLVSALAMKVTEATSRKKLALFLGLMLWLTPTLMNQITTTYIDAGVSLFIFLGYCVVVDGHEDLKRSNFFYGGLLIGLAVAIRSLSLGAFFAIMAMLGLRLFQRGIKVRVMTAGICFALGVFMTSAYWFLRDWVYTGNPLYPYLGSLFGTEDLSLFSSIYFHGMGLPRSLGSFLMIPWDITFKPQYFDYHHWVGPFYLCVLPFAGYAAISIKKARLHILFMLFFTIFWYFTGQNVRYLLPALPVYLMAVAMGLCGFKNEFFKSLRGSYLAKTAACLAIASLLGLTAYHFRFQFLRVFRIWTNTEYLEKVERTTPIAEWANRKLPDGAKMLLLEEVHLFYFDCETVLGNDFNIRTHYAEAKTPDAMVAILKKKGIAYLLDSSECAPSAAPVHFPRPPALSAVMGDPHFSKNIKAVQSSNILGSQYSYRLYELC